VCAARGACRGTGTTQSKEHSVDEGGWASDNPHEHPKPNPRTEVQPRTKQRNAEAIAYQTTADPKASNTSTGTGTSHHLSHTHSLKAGGGGRAGRAGIGISRRFVQSAAEGRGPGKSGCSEVECSMAGKARQWQHAGNNVGKRDAVGLLCGGLPAAITFV
jgi:hypothetical protein